MIIAIDGPAASGKGTLARKIAQELNLNYMDTGALYRAVAYHVLETGLNIENAADIQKVLIQLNDIFQTDAIRGVLANPALREDKVGTAASKVAGMPKVRKALLDTQKNFAKNPGEGFDGAILDGRDIGTMICPEADIKIFVTADDTQRAKRRLKELQSKEKHVSYDTVLADMRARDKRDAHTLEAHKAPGYQTNMLDTTHLGPEEAFDKALSIVKNSIV